MSGITKFLVVHSTYTAVEIGIFCGKELIEAKLLDHKRASKELMLCLSAQLKNNRLTLQDLEFIGAHQGPGPFTTLRVVIASVNGLAFAVHKPLIGVDGLDALLKEYTDTNYPITVAVLNAFANDVYYAVQTPTGTQKGCAQRVKLFNELASSYKDKTVRFIGSGAELYAQELRALFQDKLVIPEPTPAICSLVQVGAMAFEQFQQLAANNCDFTYQLTPLYLKSYAASAF
jgi:tRNA threonylcarbamoyladenosine biosynthesis protein TsaB